MGVCPVCNALAIAVDSYSTVLVGYGSQLSDWCPANLNSSLVSFATRKPQSPAFGVRLYEPGCTSSLTVPIPPRVLRTIGSVDAHIGKVQHRSADRTRVQPHRVGHSFVMS